MDNVNVLLGLGASAIGSLRQGYVQNAPGTAAYEKAIRAGHLATAKGIAVTPEDLLRQILQLLVWWLICYNSTFCENHDKTIIELTDRFRESPAKTAKNQLSYVGWLNLVFRPILIQYT